MSRTRLYKKLALAVLFGILVMNPIIEANAGNRYNMSYIYFGNTSEYYYHVDNTKNSLNEISPSYFNLDDEGNLSLTMALDVKFINEMHKKGIKVIPFLSNHWNRSKGIAALLNREILAQQLADAVIKYNLDGVNVDIENVTEQERDIYTDFVKILRDKLPVDKVLAVAVAANPYKITKGWQGSYDYKGLAEYSDYLMIMAYDESYEGGEPGPVASYNFVERSIKEALRQVPKEKVVLGIPFYGRYWKNGTEKGGYGLSNTDVVRLISNYRGKVTFDQESKSPVAEITIGAGDVKPHVLGKKLEAGTYTIWYENETSIKYKLDLVNKYDIKGTGSWSLGQETKDTWDYYDMWLNGYYFQDAQGHWAQGSIISMAHKEWMTGVSTTDFSPDKPLTRAEAAVILVRALGLEENQAKKVFFNDTQQHWAEKEIQIAAQKGIVLGIGDNKFAPDNNLTRQEMAVMLDRILNLQNSNTGKNPFKDISKQSNPWSYNSIIKLANYGIYTGNPDGTFGPRQINTRAQMAVVMDRIVPYIQDNDNGKVIAATKQ